MGSEGILVQDGEATTSFVGSRPLGVPGSEAGNRWEDRGLVGSAMSFTQSKDLMENIN